MSVEAPTPVGIVGDTTGLKQRIRLLRMAVAEIVVPPLRRLQEGIAAYRSRKEAVWGDVVALQRMQDYTFGRIYGANTMPFFDELERAVVKKGLSTLVQQEALNIMARLAAERKMRTNPTSQKPRELTYPTLQRRIKRLKKKGFHVPDYNFS